MYDHLKITFKLRCAELLAKAETARLLRAAETLILVLPAQIERFADIEDASNLNYTTASGQGADVLKPPHTDQLPRAAKSECQESDDLGEVIFFKKSAF